MSYMQTSHIQNETRTNILTFSSYSNAHNGLIKTDHILPEQVDMQASFNLACVAGPQFYGGPDLQRAGFWRAWGRIEGLQ